MSARLSNPSHQLCSEGVFPLLALIDEERKINLTISGNAARSP